MGEAKLYVIPGSHPSRTAMLMLDRKGIPFKRVDLMPVISKGVLRAQGFPGVTVPALKLEGRKVQGSREIGRELDHIQPEPPLYPADPEKRGKVEEAEEWGDQFQQKPRRFSWWAFKRNRAPMASYSEGARLGVPVGLAVKTGGPIVWAAAKLNEATDENVRADLASLPADLDRIDQWIADGVMGGGGAERGRLPDRPQRQARHDLRRPPAVHRGQALRRDGEADRDRLPGQDTASLPVRVARGPAPLDRGRAGQGHPLARPERVERRPQLRPVGEGQLGVQLE